MASTFSKLEEELASSSSGEAARFVLERHTRLNSGRVDVEVEKALVDRMSSRTIEDLSSLRMMAHMLILQNETADNETEELCRYIFSKLETPRPFTFEADEFKMHALRLQADLEDRMVLLPQYFSDRNMDCILFFVWEIIDMLESSRVLRKGDSVFDHAAILDTMVLDAAVYGGSYTVFMRKKENPHHLSVATPPPLMTRKRSRKVTMLEGRS